MNMRLQEIMTAGVVTIEPGATADAAWSRMRRARIRHLVVVDNGHMVGMLSERDLGGREGAATRRGRLVADLMTPRVANATPAMTLRQAANLMRGRLVGALPVLEDERVIGIVTATDILDELGRGSSRPDMRAQRQSMRVPPASARAATRRTGTGARARSGERAPRSGKATRESGQGAGDTVADAGRGAVTGRLTPTLGRERPRQPDSPARAPLPAQTPQPAKRFAGRTPAAATPAYIRAVGTDIDAADKAYLRRKLGRRLGKFGTAIERTSVRIEDLNGPRGGNDKRCRIKVAMSGLPSILVDERHHSLQAAMDRALTRVEGAVKRSVERRQTRPLHHRGARVPNIAG